MMDCPDCGGDSRIRNPTGKCDHLHYPENANHEWQNKYKYLEGWDGKKHLVKVAEKCKRCGYEKIVIK